MQKQAQRDLADDGPEQKISSDVAPSPRKHPWQIHSASKPRVGDPLTYEGKPAGVIKAIEGNLCWATYGKENYSEPFIWCFRDGLNKLHDWPTKVRAARAGN